jgi:phosphoglycolate phosphatase-like HAD superfamily hydrolase
MKDRMIMSNAQEAVFFDLDGTLTDPKVGITRSIRFALEKLQVDGPSEDERFTSQQASRISMLDESSITLK